MQDCIHPGSCIFYKDTLGDRDIKKRRESLTRFVKEGWLGIADEDVRSGLKRLLNGLLGFEDLVWICPEGTVVKVSVVGVNEEVVFHGATEGGSQSHYCDFS